MSYHSISEEWCKRVQEELVQMRREISSKADKSLLEQIRHQEDEKKRLFNKSKYLQTNFRINESITQQCDENVENGDLYAAFLVVLRYIERISETKADSSEITAKATHSYVDKIFEKLDIMNKDQMNNNTSLLHKSIESRLQEISDSFDSFSQSINQRLEISSANLSMIEDQLTNLSGMVPVHRTSQLSKSKFKKKVESSENYNYKSKDIHADNFMIPKKAKKPKNSGIVMPTYYKPKPEPTAKALCPAITVTSENKKTRSLLVTD